jgi:hypothetical protein
MTLVFVGARRRKGNTDAERFDGVEAIGCISATQGSFTIHMERAGNSGV